MKAFLSEYNLSNKSIVPFYVATGLYTGIIPTNEDIKKLAPGAIVKEAYVISEVDYYEVKNYQVQKWLKGEK